ncbi:MAG: HlyD family efflux transporter periplasmic adaptor subunit [Nitrospina sp.]|jgi:cobalt-zinc-cadmium efflux system membrane fusion protein|nr:HlyD family efflux transporter periplasmic adaptor subunit [Nitrospina sp.]MBT6717239.1 HlyD family efflux transporter periplasmic adaptor subunit [Nitrospina sp.]
MKIKFLLSIVILLAAGVYTGNIILNTPPKNVQSAKHEAHDHEPHSHESEHADSIPRGPHGGWLFTEKDLQVEVKIFETGIPPEFRVFITDSMSTPVPLNEVNLTIKLARLGRVDTIKFKPMGKYLLGDKTVVEPHSFNVVIHAKWKGEKYEWKFSQIEARAELTEAAIKNANITLTKAGPARIKNQINLPGEIVLNEEKVVHIVPRLDGVVKKTFKDLGDSVAPGDILATLESRELADAKINYLAAVQQGALTKSDFERETLLFHNTNQMLDLLQKEMDLEDVYQKLKDIQIGKSRELLIPAYAKMNLAKSVYLREEKLFNKGISSESEYLLAEENSKSSEAKYMALREKINYDGQWAVRKKKRNFEIEIFNLQTARQKLFALGLSNEEIEGLAHQNEQDFSKYELRSPLGGIIIQKHLTTGEAVKSDDDVFLLADLSEVWVNIAIPVKDLNFVKLGQSVTVQKNNPGLKARGKLTFLDSIIDGTSRTVTGRVVIQNPKSEWRPGTFVTLELTLEQRRVPLAVPTKAIQTIRDWSVVFVKYGNFFEARPLELGESDGTWTEVLQGLKKGESFTNQNSFILKAEIEKSSATHDH